ncbi:MAG: hypothetical protein R3C09_00090 [Pirellulaceae bacterium]|jgi:hypothetical protein
MIRHRKHGRLFVIVPFLLICGVGVAVKWSRSTSPGFVSPETWESSHVWWNKGRCNDCHQPDKSSEVLLVDRVLSGEEGEGISRQPRSHHDPLWLDKHGRSPQSSEERCFICHTVDTCQACHNHPPNTHTREFMQPGSHSTEALRHTVLARARPSSCLVCHQDFVSSCRKCHGSSEVLDWHARGQAQLERWPLLLKNLMDADSDEGAGP